MSELDPISITSDNEDPKVGDDEQQVIRVVHDESTYYANCDQSYFGGDEETNVLKQKSLGSSVMISDFVDVEAENETARLSLETRKDGYFNNELFMKQVEKAISIFEAKYPNAKGLFIFDNAPLHKKVSDDVLNADKMNVNPGRKQPIMKDTIWNGTTQKMTLPDGTPKGMKLVLDERGVDTKGMKAIDMRNLDFNQHKSILEEYVVNAITKSSSWPLSHGSLRVASDISCKL